MDRDSVSDDELVVELCLSRGCLFNRIRKGFTMCVGLAFVLWETDRLELDGVSMSVVVSRAVAVLISRSVYARPTVGLYS